MLQDTTMSSHVSFVQSFDKNFWSMRPPIVPFHNLRMVMVNLSIGTKSDIKPLTTAFHNL